MYFFSFVWHVTHDMTSSTVDGIPGKLGSATRSDTSLQSKQEEMATQNNFCAFHVAFLLVFALTTAFIPAGASSPSTKTVEFNVKPGGVVHTFSEGVVSDFAQYFLYIAQLDSVCKHHPDGELHVCQI